jgi:hypothetical protein
MARVELFFGEKRNFQDLVLGWLHSTQRLDEETENRPVSLISKRGFVERIEL